MAQPQLIICVQKQGFRSSEILSSKTRTAESEHAACCVPGHRPSVTESLPTALAQARHLDAGVEEEAGGAAGAQVEVG